MRRRCGLEFSVLSVNSCMVVAYCDLIRPEPLLLLLLLRVPSSYGEYSTLVEN
ncbi:unnamed protein product [Amoebophrya sp. A25]|nr:unnamed protein product [Amoebophrya sp. A25]|eukprot:GSA25T00015066001.1